MFEQLWSVATAADINSSDFGLVVLVVVLLGIALWGLLDQALKIKKFQDTTGVSLLYLITNAIGGMIVIAHGMSNTSLEVGLLIMTNGILVALLITLFLYALRVFDKRVVTAIEKIKDRDVKLFSLERWHFHENRQATWWMQWEDNTYALILSRHVLHHLWFFFIVLTFRLVLEEMLQEVLPEFVILVPLFMLICVAVEVWRGDYKIMLAFALFCVHWILAPFAFIVVLFGPLHQLLLLIWYKKLLDSGAEGWEFRDRRSDDVLLSFGMTKALAASTPKTDATKVLSIVRLVGGLVSTLAWIAILWDQSFWLAIFVSLAGAVTQGLSIVTYFEIKSRLKRERPAS